MSSNQQLPYRPCVGIMLFNDAGKVWIGRRIPKWAGDGSQKMWQMPQGGIDAGETPLEAARRELDEETGIREVQLLAEYPDWLNYDLPTEVVGVALGGKYRGQTQKWFAMRFSGEDRQICIDGSNGHEVEFDQWRWSDPDDVLDLVVPFKREVYRQVIHRFKDLSSL